MSILSNTYRCLGRWHTFCSNLAGFIALLYMCRCARHGEVLCFVADGYCTRCEQLNIVREWRQGLRELPLSAQHFEDGSVRLIRQRMATTGKPAVVYGIDSMCSL
jgi:hypothetical protein